MSTDGTSRIAVSSCCRAKIDQREYGMMYCSDCDDNISPYDWSMSTDTDHGSDNGSNSEDA